MPIRIGVLGTFGNQEGLQGRNGARLAVARLNAAGGIGGRPVELVEVDDFGTADSATNAALTLATSDVVAVVGAGYSRVTLTAASVFNDPDHAVAQVTPSSSAPEITEAGEWTFRICPDDLAHAAALARFVRRNLRLERAAVLYINDGYGRGFRAVFEREFTRLGGTVDSSDPYVPAMLKEASPFVERIARRGKAQFIVVAGYLADGAGLLRLVRAQGLTLPVLGGDGLAGLEREGSVAEGTYQTAAYLANLPTPANAEWVAQFRAAFPAAPPPSQMAAGYYDAVRLLADLIREVGTDREVLRDALSQVGRARPAFQGITGRIAFDSAGDVPDMTVLIARVRDGSIHPTEGR